jgi:IMP and pyridine-specific 5'-nucleotidase
MYSSTSLLVHCTTPQDNRMIQLIIDLMNLGVHVAIVTAAGYPGEAGRFEQRVQGLLAAFRQQRLPDHIVDRCCSNTVIHE